MLGLSFTRHIDLIVSKSIFDFCILDLVRGAMFILPCNLSWPLYRAPEI